jgi:hypothetical protein
MNLNFGQNIFFSREFYPPFMGTISQKNCSQNIVRQFRTKALDLHTYIHTQYPHNIKSHI